MNAIETRALTKSFDGRTNAVDGIDLAIPEGKVFGFLGPNGAGKTTAIRIINGILGPDGGEAYVLGRRSTESGKEIHGLCGVMTENASLYEGMSGNENLAFFGEIFGIKPAELGKRIGELLDQFDLKEAGDRKVKQYSTGMKKRLSLARALLHGPKVLFLDEPTSGLDPEAAKNVNEFIRKIAEGTGVTVFLCTHQLRYAEDICDLYGFIDRGRLLGFGTFRELMDMKKGSLQLLIRGKNIRPVDGMTESDGGSFTITISGDDEASSYIRRVIESGGTVYEAKQVRWSLEDLYFAFQNQNDRTTGERSC